MKKLFTVLLTVLFAMSPIIINAATSNVGYIKFYVDTSENGFSSDLRVTLEGMTLENKYINETWKIGETGNKWTYFVDAGKYWVTVYDYYKDDWNFEWNKEPFEVNQENQKIDFTIKVTRPEGYVEKKEEITEEPHFEHRDKTAGIIEEEGTSEGNQAVISENRDGTSSILLVLLTAVCGITFLGGLVFVMYKLNKRRR